MKPEPPLPPWWSRVWWWLYAYIHWPLDVREFKRAGYRRTGWMTWESP